MENSKKDQIIEPLGRENINQKTIISVQRRVIIKQEGKGVFRIAKMDIKIEMESIKIEIIDFKIVTVNFKTEIINFKTVLQTDSIQKRVSGKGDNPPAWKNEVKPKVYSEMQVTDGKHRGKFLQSTTSPKVRPTTRRIREVMFRLISRRIRGRRFLDICAGSGAVGIEAISRGALLGTFVERSAKMCSFIRKNMAAMEIKEGHGEIFEMEVVPFLKKMEQRRRFWDVVFLDPPYDTDYEEFLQYFSKGVCIKPRGILIVEHHAEMFFPEKLGVLKRWRVIIEGETALSFYERAS